MKSAFLFFLLCVAEADDIRWEVKAMFKQMNSSLEERLSSLEERLNSSLEERLAGWDLSYKMPKWLQDMASRLSASETRIEELQRELQEQKAVLSLAVTVHSAPRCLVLDCEEIYTFTTQSGVYNIYPTTAPVKVYCDMETEDGGKWTVIQRRVDGTVNFFRTWAQYKAGFGDASGEYWLGLENMHLLTKNKTYQLRVDMEDFEGNTAFASYSSFSVGSEAEGYKLQVAGFGDGGAGDSLDYHNGMNFTSLDKDQEVWKGNCASSSSGAFWYKYCHHVNINGVYQRGTTTKGVNWFHWKSRDSLKAVAMKIRRLP